jgi:hemerythrin-like metal-binding protein
MEFVEWNDSYSVDNALMDAHHQVFFRIVRMFGESIHKDDEDAMKKCIAFLVEYVSMHLNAEEALMRESAFPELDQHKILHETFARKIQLARDVFLNDPSALAAEELLQTIQNWFVNHVFGEDRKYMPYLKQRN